MVNNAERVLCLGDVVGYGPQPGECLDLLAHADFLIMGNHEEAVLHGAENFNLGPNALFGPQCHS